ncbi:hypothetical protein [Haloferax prahovense]|uniref:hypothetical protein n=1 Tax=Haloferax prahovense TaxID=381852 RepID=UPI0006795E34|nr:hypothetical protein [Haloferax prahovense]
MTQRIPLTIVSRDKRIAYDLIDPDEKRMAMGMSNEIADGVEIEFNGALIQKGIDTPPVADFVLYVGGSVALNVASSWLYDKLKDKDVSLRIGDESVELEEDTIQSKLDEFRER